MPNIFNLFLKEIMDNALQSHNGTIKMKGIIITGPRCADNIDYLADSDEELVSLAKNIPLAASKFGMEINPTKIKLMLNDNTFNPHITIKNEQIEIVNPFKYLGSIIDEQASKQ